MFVFVAAVTSLVSAAYLAAAEQRSGGNHLKAALTGDQEVPLVSSAGTGTLDMRVADDELTIDYELSYEGLEGNIPTAAVPTGVSASHIHVGVPLTNGGVSIFLCGG